MVLYRGRIAFVIFYKYPYNSGHLFVVPIDHIGDYSMLDKETAEDIHTLTNVFIYVIREVMKAHGINMGYNLGRA